jgi:hypothetical protein
MLPDSLFYGWYFERSDTACTFPGPLPEWLFAINEWLTSTILYVLCGRLW